MPNKPKLPVIEAIAGIATKTVVSYWTAFALSDSLRPCGEKLVIFDILGVENGRTRPGNHCWWETAGWRHIVSYDKRDILETLKFELAFLEQGGYGRSVRTPKTPTRSFQDSLTCLNFCEPTMPHPCSECFLTDFVPKNAQNEEVPCHHIPLNPEGETVDMLRDHQLKLEAALGNWLRATIRRLERERSATAKQEHA